MATLEREILAVDRIDTGVNALYELELPEGERAVLKAPRYADEPAFFAEPTLLSRIGRQTTVPVPTVLASVPAEAAGSLVLPFYVMEHLEGRTIDSPLELSPPARERLVREASTHLAAIHDSDAPSQFGHLEAPAGSLVVRTAFDSWWAFFDELAADCCDALHGEGPLTDASPRFADLETPIREALLDARQALANRSPQPSFVVGDYRAANLVLAERDGAEPLVQGVVDLGGQIGDGLLDVALTEDALIDLPLGGTPEAASLRDTFRTVYAEGRSLDRAAIFDERYPYYRLYARTRRLKAFDYSAQFARESTLDAVARRCRSFVDDRLSRIHDGQG